MSVRSVEGRRPAKVGKSQQETGLRTVASRSPVPWFYLRH